MSYKKVGGLHFVKLGRVGFSFYVSRAETAPKPRARTAKPKLLGIDHLLATCKPVTPLQ